MTDLGAKPDDGAKDEVSALIDLLHRTSARIEALTGGEVDAVTDQEGKPFLLRHAQEHLRQIEAARQAAILDALPAHVAVLDPFGRIVSVNNAWRSFASANGLVSPNSGIGDNYLSVCNAATGESALGADRIASGIAAVLSGSEASFSLEYPCHSPTEKRWFLMTATPLSGNFRAGAVVMHVNVSAEKQAAHELLESETRFSSAFEDAPIGIALVSVEGRWLRINRALCDLFGYSKAELLSLTLEHLTHPEDLEADLENARRLIAGTTRSFETETRYRHARGHLVSASLNVSLVRDGLGDPSYFIAHVQDITERKRSERAAERALLRLTEAQRIGQIGDWECDLVTGVIIWSPQVFEILGRDPGLGPPDYNAHAALYEGASQTVLAENVARVLESGNPQEYELRARRPDGVQVDILSRAAARKDQNGQVVGMYGTVQDISHRKAGEDALRRSEEEFRALAESMPQMVWITRPDGWNIYFSQQWKDYTGLTLEESLGQGWSRPFHPEDASRAWDAWLAATTSVGRYSVEARLRRADGVYRWWLIRGVPVKDEAGRVLKWFGTCTDIHDLKVAELEIARSNRVYAMLSGINTLIVRVREQDELLREACRIAVEAGGFRMSLIAVVDSRTEAIVPVASAGKDEGLLADVALTLSHPETAAKTMVVRAIREKTPVVANDSMNDPRLILGGRYRESEVRSVAVLPLLFADEAVGVLALYSGEIDFFHEAEMKLLGELANDIAFCMGALRSRDHKEKADDALRASLKEKEALLKEVHHRVKNNMQVITSLLRLEANRIDHPTTRAVLKDMQNRILAMAALHEALYRSNSFAQVDLGSYLKELTTQLKRSLVANSGQISFRLQLLLVGLDLDQAVPCGLIVNELVSNALKHGFPNGRRGEVRVETEWVREGLLRLRISDDGVGLSRDFGEIRVKSLGLQLVADLARQLGGGLVVGPGPEAVFDVTFRPDRQDDR